MNPDTRLQPESTSNSGTIVYNALDYRMKCQLIHLSFLSRALSSILAGIVN